MLYLISNRLAFRRNTETENDHAWRSQLGLIADAATAGCRLIQIREKDLSARRLCNLTREAIALARPFGARVLVNDRLDVALASDADGVHLRVSSLPVAEVRAAVDRIGLDEFLIGVSTHSAAEARAAESGGADFIVCGPVYDTPSKREFGEPLGVERFGGVCRSVGIPVLAVGGINLSNFREPLRNGAAGIAAIGLFSDQPRLVENIRTILSADSR